MNANIKFNKLTMIAMKKIVFTVEKTDTGYSAYCEDAEGFVATVGSTMAELKANMVEAYNLHQEETGNSPIREEDLAVKFDLPQFFEYYKEINAKALARRVGMNETLLSQYVNGKKEPSDKQVSRILQGIRDLGKELLDFA
jgi:predicted RNase H-like HicB family nuclease